MLRYLWLFLFCRKEKKVRFHNSSILYQPPAHGETVSNAQAKAITKLPSDWLIYEEMTRFASPVTVGLVK